jgi:hypothetical protein
MKVLNVFVRFGKLFVTLVLAATICGHWALIQTFAWTTMLAGNLQSNSLQAAMSMTFDGKHPCPICSAIAAGKKSENKSPLAPIQNFDFPIQKEIIVLIAPSRLDNSPLEVHFLKSFTEKPLTPPPRSLAA